MTSFIYSRFKKNIKFQSRLYKVTNQGKTNIKSKCRYNALSKEQALGFKRLTITSIRYLYVIAQVEIK